MLRRSFSLVFGLAMMVVAGQAQAVPITDLYSTGVADDGTLLAPGASDTHYVLTASADPAAPAGSMPKVVSPGFPIPPWAANTATAQWVAPVPNKTEPNGDYDYTTTFTLSGAANLSSVLIAGLLSSDDTVADVLLNGVSLGITTPVGIPGFSFLHGFSIDGSLSPFFVTGVNTLTFKTQNLFGFTTGLIVDIESATYTLVPEPSSMVLACLGVAGLAFIRRRKMFA